jgi:hypothetical protein
MTLSSNAKGGANSRIALPARDGFNKAPFRPKALRVNFHTQINISTAKYNDQVSLILRHYKAMKDHNYKLKFDLWY